MRCAVIDKDGKVVNTIVADPEKDPAPEGTTLVGIGYAPIDSDAWTASADGTFTKTLTAADVKAFADMEKADLAAEVAVADALNPG